VISPRRHEDTKEHEEEEEGGEGDKGVDMKVLFIIMMGEEIK